MQYMVWLFWHCLFYYFQSVYDVRLAANKMTITYLLIGGRAWKVFAADRGIR